MKDYKSAVKSLAESGDVATTAEAAVTTQFASMKQVDGLIDDATVMLSYATGTYIAMIYQDVYFSGMLVKSVPTP